MLISTSNLTGVAIYLPWSTVALDRIRSQVSPAAQLTGSDFKHHKKSTRTTMNRNLPLIVWGWVMHQLLRLFNLLRKCKAMWNCLLQIYPRLPTFDAPCRLVEQKCLPINQRRDYVQACIWPRHRQYLPTSALPMFQLCSRSLSSRCCSFEGGCEEPSCQKVTGRYAAPSRRPTLYSASHVSKTTDGHGTSSTARRSPIPTCWLSRQSCVAMLCPFCA